MVHDRVPHSSQVLASDMGSHAPVDGVRIASDMGSHAPVDGVRRVVSQDRLRSRGKEEMSYDLFYPRLR
jgi:hypothetical protein